MPLLWPHMFNPKQQSKNWSRNRTQWTREEARLDRMEEDIRKARQKADKKKLQDWLNEILSHRKNFRDFHEKVRSRKAARVRDGLQTAPYPLHLLCIRKAVSVRVLAPTIREGRPFIVCPAGGLSCFCYRTPRIDTPLTCMMHALTRLTGEKRHQARGEERDGVL